MSDLSASRIGLAVRAARKLQGLSQEDLAAKIGRRAATISDIERGVNVPDLGTAWAIADALRLPLDDVLGRDGLTPQATASGTESLGPWAARTDAVLGKLLQAVEDHRMRLEATEAELAKFREPRRKGA